MSWNRISSVRVCRSGIAGCSLPNSPVPQIKVAVSADGDCVRAYSPEVSSSNFNTLSMTVKTSEPDNLLFYMGSSSSVRGENSVDESHGPFVLGAKTQTVLL